jgi:predicted secreted hydrolase
MPASTRWLVAALVLLLASAGFFALSRWLHTEPVPSRAGGGFDLAGVLDELSEDSFERPMGAWRLGLPLDHGAHPNARTETWNISAQLRDDVGEDIGIQFALLRVGLVSPDAAERASPWELRALHRAHVTLLDGAQDAAAGEERFHRDVPGVAGHDAARREVWLDNWTIQYGEGNRGDQLRLDATVGEMALGLLFTPAKAAVALNPDGANAPFRGYSITRMVAVGFIGAGVDRRSLSGLAWLDHVWGDVPLPLGPIVSDRLQLQLNDGTDLLVTRTRRRDGGGTPTLAGYAVDPHGGMEPLASAALEMEATRTWRDAVGASFPLDWRLRAGELQAHVSPIADDQVHDFAVPLWSGIVTVEGVLRDRRVFGRGTLLLTGDAIR